MKRNGYVRHTVLGIVMLFSFVITSVPGFLPEFFGAYPVVLVPFVASVGLFEKETVAGFYGLAAGMLVDLYSAHGGIYSTLALCLIGFAAGLISRFFLVENFYSALALSAGAAFLHLTGYWLIFIVFSGGVGEVFYAYYRQILPAMLYTVVFIILFYPLVRSICLKARKE